MDFEKLRRGEKQLFALNTCLAKLDFFMNYDQLEQKNSGLISVFHSF
ncbi:MAG: hypothetical protein RL699_576 [Bacteroidota bacterium]|jgi:hypothetical protein